ncbi:MAG: hypothetical protein MUD10_03685 [Candidatus Pacebacteria bacterium]|jgi:hypothetical protein|nr:hypothetical protein [Candidatus Paceibacterota bacterium]
MAITFEERSNTGKMIASILAVLVLLGAAGFFAWKYMVPENTVPVASPTDKDGFDEKTLTDARIDELELFPEVPPSSVPAGKLNPFSESTATSSIEAEPVAVPVVE